MLSGSSNKSGEYGITYVGKKPSIPYIQTSNILNDDYFAISNKILSNTNRTETVTSELQEIHKPSNFGAKKS